MNNTKNTTVVDDLDETKAEVVRNSEVLPDGWIRSGEHLVTFKRVLFFRDAEIKRFCFEMSDGRELKIDRSTKLKKLISRDGTVYTRQNTGEVAELNEADWLSKKIDNALPMGVVEAEGQQMVLVYSHPFVKDVKRVPQQKRSPF